MSFAEVTMYVALCDGCGKRHENSEFAGWVQTEGALAAAEDDEWRVQDDNRLLCPECRLKPGGDIFEDDPEAVAEFLRWRADGHIAGSRGGQA